MRYKESVSRSMLSSFLGTHYHVHIPTYPDSVLNKYIRLFLRDEGVEAFLDLMDDCRLWPKAKTSS